MTTWCLIPNLVLYALASGCYLALTLGQRFRLAEVASVLTLFGALLQAIYLFYLFAGGVLLPFHLLSFGTVLLFLWLQWRYQWSSLGSLFLPLALLLFLLGLEGHEDRLLLTNIPGLKILHILLASCAVLFFIGSFLLGIVFWIHERGLREKKWGFLVLNLPPLVLNEQSARHWLRIGFVLLSLVLISGALLLSRAPTIHVVLAILSWLAYALVLNRSWSRFGSGKILLLSALGFVTLVGAYLWNLA